MSGLELGLVLFSALLHATWNATTKGSANPTTFLVAIELVSFAAYLPLLVFGIDLSQIPMRVWVCALVSGVAHAFYVHWLARGYAHEPLSVVYPIARSTPAFLPLLAVPLLGEAVSLLGALGIALVVAGMWAIQTDGRFERRRLLSLGAGFAYLTLAATVVYSLVDKDAMRLLGELDWRAHTPRALAYMALFYVFYLPVLLVITRRVSRLRDVPRLARAEPFNVLGSGLCGVAGYAIVLYVLQTAPVSYVVAVRQSSVLFAVLLGAMFLRERPGRVRLLGALANVAGVTLVAMAR